ncbi:helix-turn-helix domain-containing protein [Nocardia sp. NPDC051570]|uniref:helix-turn-helix domain-containing protein n=1 Tax=Nocardia sp. NPDC051570 TaxID=3364324 RepID=UPI0037B0F379
MSTSKPDPNAPYWTRDDVAAYLGWSPQTVSSYLNAKRLPAPSDRVGKSPIWLPRVIIAWDQGGRPKQTDA